MTVAPPLSVSPHFTTEAERNLRELAAQLERFNPDAAGSLREGLAEMFTVTRLGVRGTLLGR